MRAGVCSSKQISWQAGLPLQIFEDPNLNIPAADRTAWLSRMAHRFGMARMRCIKRITRMAWSVCTRNSRATISKDFQRRIRSLSEDERLMREFARRKRELVEADMLIVAQDHWNFDVRGFNPGGNHGSFFRISTHSSSWSRVERRPMFRRRSTSKHLTTVSVLFRHCWH